MHEVISMSIKELDRLRILDQLSQKQINQKQAADILCVSIRQIKRLVKSYRKNGAKGLISKKRGRASDQQLPIFYKEVSIGKILEKQVNFEATLTVNNLLRTMK